MNLWTAILTVLVITFWEICSGKYSSRRNKDKDSGTDIIDKLFKDLPKSYNRRVRPFFGVKPVNVEVFMYVSSLRSISEQTMDYKLELYYREFWVDDRLAFNPKRYNNMTTIPLHESLSEQLWVPDTFIPNAVTSENPSSSSITHRSLLRLNSDGAILFSRRLSITAECPMDLSLYPFDQQICQLSIESYGHSTADIIYHWREKAPVALNKKLKLPSFKVTGLKFVSRNITLSTGTYSRLELCFVFTRSAAFYFVQLFIPATAIVITSWLSLWMEKESTFADMIEVILAITFLYYSYNTMMPKVSYIKAMDIYLGACFIFVFLSLIKLATLKFIKERLQEEEDKTMEALSKGSNSDIRKINTYVRAPEDENAHFPPPPVFKNGDVPAAYPQLRDMRPYSLTLRICSKCFKFSRRATMFIFPMSFLCFTVLYFIVFIVAVGRKEENLCEFD